jgi:hypothetical protein
MLSFNLLRQAVRTLVKSPGFSAIAVLALALGIGANTAIFSVVNAVVLRPSAYRDLSRLALVGESIPKVGGSILPCLLPMPRTLRMVLRQATLLAAIGVGIGIAGAVGLTRFLSTLLFEIRPIDPFTMAAAAALLVAVARFASFVPAHRATRLDPAAALRFE